MRSILAPVLALVASCLMANGALAATDRTVHDAERGFTFALPDGYADYPEGRAGNVIHAFARGKPDDAGFALIRIEAMGGTIGREPPVRATVERAARDSVRGTGVELTRFDYRKVKWKSFDLDLVVTHAAAGDRKLVLLGTQVPLAKEAIQIGVMGPAADEAKLTSDLTSLLGSLDAKSNWLSDDDRDERLGRLVGMAVGGAAAVAIVLWLRRRRRA